MSSSTQSDLLVVGFDRATACEVHIDDAPLESWHAKSFRRGDGSLICHHCYIGDEVPAGTVVPLIVRGRYRGARRPHFAQPPGMAPVNGHSPETLWHSMGKHLVARWANSLPTVSYTRLEHRLVDGSRRADVMVTFTDGRQLAIELQHRLVPDPDWLARHHSYTARGIADVWLWHHRIRHLPRILLHEGLPIWTLDVDAARLGIGYGAPHRVDDDRYLTPDPAVHDGHHPPCAGDEISWVARPLAHFGLDAAAGIALPMDVVGLLAAARSERQVEAATEAARRRVRGSRMAAPTVCIDPAGAISMVPTQRGAMPRHIECG